jgi:hypothetical protein
MALYVVRHRNHYTLYDEYELRGSLDEPRWTY